MCSSRPYVILPQADCTSLLGNLVFPLACSLLVSFGLRETRKPTKYQDYVPLGEAQAEIDSPETPTTSPRFSKDEQDNAVTSEDDKVVPLLELMKNSNIQVAILNYGFLALVRSRNIAYKHT